MSMEQVLYAQGVMIHQKDLIFTDTNKNYRTFNWVVHSALKELDTIDF